MNINSWFLYLAEDESFVESYAITMTVRKIRIVIVHYTSKIISIKIIDTYITGNAFNSTYNTISSSFK